MLKEPKDFINQALAASVFLADKEHFRIEEHNGERHCIFSEETTKLNTTRYKTKK